MSGCPKPAVSLRPAAAPPRPRAGPGQGHLRRRSTERAASSPRTVPGPERVSPRRLPGPSRPHRAEARPELHWTGLGVTAGPGRLPQVGPPAAAWTSPTSLALVTSIAPSRGGGCSAASWRPHLPPTSPTSATLEPCPGLPGICHPVWEGWSRPGICSWGPATLTQLWALPVPSLATTTLRAHSGRLTTYSCCPCVLVGLVPIQWESRTLGDVSCEVRLEEHHSL